MATIQIPVGSEGDLNPKQFEGFCKDLGCRLHPKKRGDIYWVIESDSPTDFFWLAANLYGTFPTSPLTCTLVEKHLRS